MENLTKENFWNEMMQKYPLATKQFCDWIDEYKKQNNWNKLFNQGYNSFTGPIPAPKYHDLPLAMQTGIAIEFMQEHKAMIWNGDTRLQHMDIRSELEIALSFINEELATDDVL